MEIKDVENLAELARIELAEDEKKDLLSDMESILGYVKQIEEINLEDVQVRHDITNMWREDEVAKRQFSKELITGQFPNSQDGFLKVKKIL